MSWTEPLPLGESLCSPPFYLISNPTLSLSNIFVIGEGSKPWVSLPKGKGVKLSIAEERDQRRRLRAEQA
jgi:hypothetical protein